MTDNYIIDQSGDHKYFTIIPNILWVKDLTALERWLYATIKKIAGDDGECFMSTPTLAEEAGISAGSISKAKQTLQDKGLIKIVRRKRSAKGHAIDHITIIDIWEQNILHFVNRSANERNRSADETEEEPLKKNPEEETVSPVSENTELDYLDLVLATEEKQQKHKAPIKHLEGIVLETLGMKKAPNYLYDKNWFEPLTDILDQADGDLDRAGQAIRTATATAKANALTITSPKSLHGLALQELADRDNGQTQAAIAKEAAAKEIMRRLAKEHGHA